MALNRGAPQLARWRKRPDPNGSAGAGGGAERAGPGRHLARDHAQFGKSLVAFPRVAAKISLVLCDACILSIFEGAAEIQAQVIARGLLGRLN